MGTTVGDLDRLGGRDPPAAKIWRSLHRPLELVSNEPCSAKLVVSRIESFAGEDSLYFYYVVNKVHGTSI